MTLAEAKNQVALITDLPVKLLMAAARALLDDVASNLELPNSTTMERQRVLIGTPEWTALVQKRGNEMKGLMRC